MLQKGNKGKDFDRENIDGFDAKLRRNVSKFSLSIISSSMTNTGGLDAVRQCFLGNPVD